MAVVSPCLRCAVRALVPKLIASNGRNPYLQIDYSYPLIFADSTDMTIAKDFFN
jgi:hypothetical protein